MESSMEEVTILKTMLVVEDKSRNNLGLLENLKLVEILKVSLAI